MPGALPYSRALQPGGGLFGNMGNMGAFMEQARPKCCACLPRVCVRCPAFAELWVQQMKSAQADAAKLQAELALTNFEGFSSDETVKATVDGSQAREHGSGDALRRLHVAEASQLGAKRVRYHRSCYGARRRAPVCTRQRSV